MVLISLSLGWAGMVWVWDAFELPDARCFHLLLLGGVNPFKANQQSRIPVSHGKSTGLRSEFSIED